MDSWLVALITGVLTVSGTVMGVLVTQRGERVRNQEDRLWRERASVYVEILAWANDVNAWALRRRAGPGELLPSRPAALPRLQYARVLAFAGAAVREHIEKVEYELMVASDSPDHAVGLHVQADAQWPCVKV
jgi:hypothetical protein